MLLVKFEKVYPASFMSHLDILRSILRLCVRAGIKVRRSENAFNPHYKVFFTPPLPLTVESKAEYTCIDTDFDASEFIEKFNQNAPKGLRAIFAKNLEKNPNVAGIVTFSDYEVNVKTTQKQKNLLESILNQKECFITYEQKGEIVEKEVRSKILDIKVYEGKITLTLASGNDNLRVDRLLYGIKGLNLEFDLFDVLRTEQYTGEKDSLVPLFMIGENDEE